MNKPLDLSNLRQNLAAAFVECGLAEPMYRLCWEFIPTGETMCYWEWPLEEALQNCKILNEAQTEPLTYRHWVEAVQP